MPGASTVPRALLVALGGTGRQIVVDVRRRICERFGGVESKIPCQRYIYLDTDASDVNRPEATLLDPEEVNLPASSKVHLSVTNVRNLRDRLGHFPHLKKWLPETALTGDIVQGAGAIRARGRLGLVWNIDKVRQAFNSGWTAINAADMATQVAQRSNGLAKYNQALPARVYVVGSLRGGTGAGTFIDIGYLARKWLGGSDYGLIGLFMLPGRAATYAENACNAYAALQELNHWNYFDTAFHAEYGPQSVIETVGPVYEPPFNYMYLVEPTNQAGNSVSDEELVAMVAQSVFFDLIGEDTSVRRGSFRDNFDAYLLQPDMVGNPQHYMSLGIGLIRFPKDKVLSALTFRLAAEALLKLQQGLAEGEWSPENLNAHVRDALRARELRHEDLAAQLRLRAGGQTVTQQIAHEVDQLARRHLQTGGGSLSDRAERAMNDYKREHLGDTAVDVLPDRRDPRDLAGYVRHVHERYQQVSQTAKAQLENMVADFVSNDRLRLSLAAKALEVVSERLKEDQERAKARRDALRQSGSLSGTPAQSGERAAVDRRRDLLERLRQAEGSSLVLSLWPAAPVLRRWAWYRYFRAEAQAVTDVVEAYVMEYSAQVLEDLAASARALQERLKRVASVLSEQRQSWLGEADRAAHPRSSVFGKEVWDPETDLDRMFNEALRADPNLTGLLTDLRGQLQLANDYELVLAIASGDPKAIQTLLSLCRRRFQGMLEEQDVTELLLGLPTKAQDIEQLLQHQSVPFIQIRSDYPEWRDEPAKNMRLIGVSNACRRSEELLRLVEETTPNFDRNRDLIDVQDRSYFLARQEICGFPLAAMTVYEQLFSAFRRDTAGTPRYTRTDVEWRELTQPSNVEQFNAMVSLLAGWLGGLVDSLGDLGQTEPSLGFRFEYTAFDRPVVVTFEPVVLRGAPGQQGAQSRELCYGPLDRRMPKALAPVLQAAAKNREATEALSKTVDAAVQKNPFEFAYRVEKRARELWEAYPVLKLHFGSIAEAERGADPGPVRLALDELWEKHGLGVKQAIQGGGYNWRWTDEMRAYMAGQET